LSSNYPGIVADTTGDRPQPLSPDEEAFIRSLGRVLHALPRVMDAELVREQRLPLIEYMTLMRLSEAPGQHLRMSELAAVVDMSLSGMTRVVTRLESEGLVQRVRCTEDGRGWNAVLTAAGLGRLEQAWPSHLAAVRRHVLAHFHGIDLGPLTRAFQRIAT
jgi:DNA-binding MarR family transcriptional regulator